MAIEKTKDVRIGERDFQIGLLPADVGNWAGTMMLGGRVNDEAFSKIQGHLLGKCALYNQVGNDRLPVPIYQGGKWLVAELEYDLITVNELYRAAMAFNFDPFFANLESQGLLTRRVSPR